MENKISKKKIAIISIVAVLIIARLMLPYFVKNYVNKVLANIEGYKGSIDDIDIALIRGAYVIHGLKLEKVENKTSIPFIAAKSIDLSIEWKAIFKGAIKGEVIFNHADLNFVAGKTEKSTQAGTETDWTKPLKKLMPLQINRFEILNGKVSYKDLNASPKVDVYIKQLHLLATNLSNLENGNKKLPSVLVVEGNSVGNGNLLITGNMNVLKEIPDADLNMKFTHIQLPALNDFAKAYGKFDFEKGTLSIFSELSLADSKILGYVKPIVENVRVLDWVKEDENVTQKLWQGLIGVTMDIFKNHPKKQFATKVPIEGSLANINTPVFPTIINVLKNTFIKAYPKMIDNTVSFEANKEQKDKKFLFFKIGKKKDTEK